MSGLNRSLTCKSLSATTLVLLFLLTNSKNFLLSPRTWRNYGKNKVTNGDKIIEKSYFRIKNGKEESDNFQKVMLRYYGSDYNHITIVQYLGDETEYKGSSHGNRKHGFRPHKRTLPSVLDKIKSTGDENPKSVKDKIDSENSVPLKLTGINSIRNVKQVENAQYNSRKNKKFGHDSLYNLHELVYHLESYIHEIKTVPDLQVVIGYTDIFQEFDRLLQLKTNDPIPLYYDTTFCLGDFYVSTLAFQHIMFEENPVIPLAFMVHERKFQKCHEQFFEIIKEKIPRLGRKAIPLYIDSENPHEMPHKRYFIRVCSVFYDNIDLQRKRFIKNCNPSRNSMGHPDFTVWNIELFLVV